MSRKVNKIVKLITGLLIMVSLLCQLFTFEKFSAVLTSAGIPSSLSLLVAIILVVVELMSLSFLIDMDISKKAILVSRVSGFVSLGVMLAISFMAFVNGSESVIFGATIKHVSNIIAIFILSVLSLLFIVANLRMKKTAK